ncbi:putative mitochondrion protein [Naematelia encephala]|uniref:Putative mitochondrion protein n=1 Tax=Naematelia encephala TaxID=71784 RepID=A0A1Y2B1V3_9TREE|nr:putative mitochondrion protein [Naematelia encephala]
MSLALLSQPTTSRTGAAIASALHLQHRRAIHISPARFLPSTIPKPPHVISQFDTNQFVTRLTDNGLSRDQAESIMGVFQEVVDESVKGLEGVYVTRSDHEKQRYDQRIDFAQLKSDLQHNEKNDLTAMRAENSSLMNEVEKLKQRLREELTRTQAGVRLDLNLEKGRIKEEASQQELKIREVDTRIESEIAGLRTQIEQAKFSILQYLVGVATGSAALLLAYMRMMM